MRLMPPGFSPRKTLRETTSDSLICSFAVAKRTEMVKIGIDGLNKAADKTLFWGVTALQREAEAHRSRRCHQSL